MSHFTVLIDVPHEGHLDFQVADVLEPFYEQTEDKDYLEFIDKTAEIQDDYLNKTADCIQTPDGRFLPQYHAALRGLVIKDGTVVSNHAGPLHHAKKTRKSRKYKAHLNYPLRKIYKSIESYAEEYCYYTYSDSEQAYGYYTNPNAFWDWYQIGGRWPFELLVKADCSTYDPGDRSWTTEKSNMRPAPEGYIWVPAAAKGDVEWELMRELGIRNKSEKFKQLKECFDTGVLPPDSPLTQIAEDGIHSWGKLIYRKDETLEGFLERNNLGDSCKYPVNFYGCIRDGEYLSVGDMGWWGISSNEKEEQVWRSILQQYIESVPDEHILVVVDCHI